MPQTADLDAAVVSVADAVEPEEITEDVTEETDHQKEPVKKEAIIMKILIGQKLMKSQEDLTEKDVAAVVTVDVAAIAEEVATAEDQEVKALVTKTEMTPKMRGIKESTGIMIAEMNVGRKEEDDQDDFVADQDDHHHKALVMRVNIEEEIAMVKVENTTENDVIMTANAEVVADVEDAPEETSDHVNQRPMVKVHQKAEHTRHRKNNHLRMPRVSHKLSKLENIHL